MARYDSFYRTLSNYNYYTASEAYTESCAKIRARERQKRMADESEKLKKEATTNG